MTTSKRFYSSTFLHKMKIKYSWNHNKEMAKSKQKLPKKKPNQWWWWWSFILSGFVYKSGGNEDNDDDNDNNSKCFRINHAQKLPTPVGNGNVSLIAFMWLAHASISMAIFIGILFFLAVFFFFRYSEGCLSFIFHIRKFLLRIHHANKILFMRISDLCFRFPRRWEKKEEQERDEVE